MTRLARLRARTVSLLGVLAVGIALVAVVPASAQQAAYTYLAFEVTGKVRCQIDVDDTDQSARCDVAGATFEKPARPSDCPAEWGSTVGLSANYRAPSFQCVGDALNSGDALVPGDVRALGDITCTAIVDGVQCRLPDGVGFSVTPTAWTWLRPEGKALFSPTGLTGLKVHMSFPRARRTKTVTRVPSDCGGIARFQPKGRYENAYVVWRKNRVDSVIAWSKATVSTTTGVGVGSSLADAQRAYPDARLMPVSWPYGASALVEKQGRNKLWMMFTPGYGESVWSGTRMEVMVASRSWRPAKQLDYHGCGYGS